MKNFHTQTQYPNKNGKEIVHTGYANSNQENILQTGYTNQNGRNGSDGTQTDGCTKTWEHVEQIEHCSVEMSIDEQRCTDTA